MLADDLAEVVVELKGVARLRQLAFEVVAEKADRAIQSDVGNALQFGTKSRVNAAAKARTDGRVGISGRTQRIAACIHQRRVRAAAKTLGCGNSAAARRGDGVGHGRRVELRLSFAEIGEAKLVHGGRAHGPRVAGVHLLGMSNDAAREISEGPAGQLKDGKGIERVVVVVVIVDRKLLVFV